MVFVGCNKKNIPPLSLHQVLFTWNLAGPAKKTDLSTVDIAPLRRACTR